MSFELWLSFVLASAALLAIPGPTVILVVSYALGRGRSTGWATIPGITLGNFTVMTISLLGAGAVLAASATLFTVLKLAGAAYLVWLGIQLWRADPRPEALEAAEPAREGRSVFWNAYAVTALNPKSIVFFAAFLPLFTTAERPLLPQFVILEATFLGLGVVNALIWAALAGEVRARFLRPGVLRLVNRIGGGMLIGAGALTALARRAD